ncbi:MAG: TonB-dependent receptor [Alphaproteobacteria bacterium]
MFSVSRAALFTTVSILTISCAQAAYAAEAATDAKTNTSVSELVVTGRVGSTAMAKAQASYAITTLSDSQLQNRAPTSTAEVFKAVPGFWVESSGGEASDNVRARGIPTDGFSSVSLQEDGLPVQHDGGLGYLNADQSFRYDLSIGRVEAVRGGPSAVFAPNAPGGTVNFITRKIGDKAEGIIKVEIGDYDRYRTDIYYGAPLGNGWSANVSGFYRSDNGVRNPGYTANKGGQIRFGLFKDFENGHVEFNLKRIEDNVAFYLPVPLTFDSSGDVTSVPGFDANFGTLIGPESAHQSFRNVNGPYDFDLTKGTDVKLTQATMKADFDLGDGWAIKDSLRYRDSDTQRNGLFPTGNVDSAATRLASLKAQALAAYPTATNVQFRFVDNYNLVFDVANNKGNGQVVSGNNLAVHVPLKEFINDVRLTKSFDVAGQKHDFAFGAYFADVTASFVRYMSTSQLEVASNARLLDAVAVDASGAIVGKLSENGYIRYGSLFDNAHYQMQNTAIYAADEWQVTEALRIDAGVRQEKSKITGSVEGKKTVDLGVAGTLADNQVITGTGLFTPIQREFNLTTYTIGANWQINNSLGAFARLTKTGRMPSGGDFTGNPLRTDVKVTPIDLYEAGLKYISPTLDVFATAYQTKYNGVTFTDNVFSTATNSYTQRIGFADTDTKGVEIEATYRPLTWFDIFTAASISDPQYKGFKFTNIVAGQPVVVTYDGKQLIRVPKQSIRIVPGVNLDEGRFRAELEIESYSKRYADIVNTQALPAYTVLNANAHYDLTPQLRVSFNATNLNNVIGLTEGNPRAGEFIAGNAGAKYFLARPIFGRTYRAALTYKF